MRRLAVLPYQASRKRQMFGVHFFGSIQETRLVKALRVDSPFAPDSFRAYRRQTGTNAVTTSPSSD